MKTTRPVVRYDSFLMAEDMADKGWNPKTLAKKAGVSDMSAYRFLADHTQTAKIAAKLAKALGRSVRRYRLATQRRAA